MDKKVRPIHTSRMQWGSKMETVGDTLKKERHKQKKDIEAISLDTKIDAKKLKALEENNFSVFDSPIMIKGFIKIYSQHLGLNPEKILAIYRRDFGEKVKKEEKTIVEEKKKFPWKLTIFIFPLVIIILLLAYLQNQFYQFQNPPMLEILEPQNNIVVQEDILNIKGKTDMDTIVEIGEQKVPVNNEGLFETKVPLEQGKNIFTVRARNSRNPSRESVEILHITYEKAVELVEEELQIEKIALNVKVENNPTWIEIILDDQMIISQILPQGYERDFEAQRNIQINTGIIQNTRLEVNGEPIGLSSETFSVRCELLEGILQCN